MGHAVVQRVALVLCALLAAMAFGFASLAGLRTSVPPAAEPDSRGATLFREHCGSCHATAEMAASPVVRTASAGDPGPLVEFLRDHGDAAVPENLEISAYLARLRP